MALPDGVDFYVNENRILEPLDLVVLRDSRVDLFPRAKETCRRNSLADMEKLVLAVS
jgi:hypothetical protein